MNIRYLVPRLIRGVRVPVGETNHLAGLDRVCRVRDVEYQQARTVDDVGVISKNSNIFCAIVRLFAAT